MSISLYPPLWYDGHRYPLLAPTPSIFSDRRSGALSDKEFELRYVKEVLSRWPDASALLSDLEAHMSKSIGRPPEDVTMLCFERPGVLCHRRFVARWLEQGGVEVKEYLADVRCPPTRDKAPAPPATTMIFESLDF